MLAELAAGRLCAAERSCVAEHERSCVVVHEWSCDVVQLRAADMHCAAVCHPAKSGVCRKTLPSVLEAETLPSALGSGMPLLWGSRERTAACQAIDTHGGALAGSWLHV
jgi:hypothetical protein